MEIFNSIGFLFLFKNLTDFFTYSTDATESIEDLSDEPDAFKVWDETKDLSALGLSSDT